MRIANCSNEYINITFKELSKSKKTSIYEVTTISHHWMGIIKWYAPWRQYAFFTVKDRIWTPDCMDFISKFIKDLMESHKQYRKEQQ